MYENTRDEVPVPLAYVAYLPDNPAKGIRGLPVTVTAAENATVTDTMSSALYVLSGPADDVKLTDDTVGALTEVKSHNVPALSPA